MRQVIGSIFVGIAAGAGGYAIATAVDTLDLWLRIVVSTLVAIVATGIALIVSRKTTTTSHDTASDLYSRKGSLKVSGVKATRRPGDASSVRTASGLRARGDITVSDIEDESK